MFRSSSQEENLPPGKGTWAKHYEDQKIQVEKELKEILKQNQLLTFELEMLKAKNDSLSTLRALTPLVNCLKVLKSESLAKEVESLLEKEVQKLLGEFD